MANSKLKGALAGISYEEWAQIYQRSLTLEHYMEATPQATQRKITLESLDLVEARRPDFHLFNELLVQYPSDGKDRPGQVVPDNMVVIHPGEIYALGSYDLPSQPARPFWVFEYVSKSSIRKDYETNFAKYEKELHVPYYLLFYPDIQDMSLYRLAGGRYAAVVPNEHGRCALPELEIEVGLLDGWVRFWYQGQLLPLPPELQRDLDDARRERDDARRQRDDAQRQRDDAQRQRDDARERAADLEAQLALEREDRLALQRELERLKAQFGGGPPNGG